MPPIMIFTASPEGMPPRRINDCHFWKYRTAPPCPGMALKRDPRICDFHHCGVNPVGSGPFQQSKKFQIFTGAIIRYANALSPPFWQPKRTGVKICCCMVTYRQNTGLLISNLHIPCPKKMSRVESHVHRYPHPEKRCSRSDTCRTTVPSGLQTGILQRR